MKTCLRNALAALAVGLLSTPLHAAIHYSQNFETDSAGASGGLVESTEGFAALGFGNAYYRNGSGGPTTIDFTLGSAAADVTVTLDLVALDSWDGNDPFWGVDTIDVRIDDRVVLTGTIGNLVGTTQTLSVLNQIVAPTANLAVNSGYPDSAYRFTLALGDLGTGAHAITVVAYSGPGGTTGYQGGGDESFAIDNVLVTSAVPEPSTYALLAVGVGLLALRRRR